MLLKKFQAYNKDKEEDLKNENQKIKGKKNDDLK